MQLCPNTARVLENLDNMLLHFRGREEELVKTLHNMQDEKVGQDKCYNQLSKDSFILESDSGLSVSDCARDHTIV